MHGQWPVMSMLRSLPVALLGLMLVSIAFAGCLETFASNRAPEVALTVTPSGTVTAGEEITFDASATVDRDGDILVFIWDFDDSDGLQREEAGAEVTWTYAVPGTYTVTLTVEDDQFSVKKEKVIEVLEADTIKPVADPGSRMGEPDCDDEATSSSSREFYLYTICEDLDLNDREMDATVDVELDATASSHADPNHYITTWEWDLDINTDSDGNGDVADDIDATGETYTWQDRDAGKWEIQLTVRDDRGLSDSDEITVYVNYWGIWKDFNIDGNSTGGGANPSNEIEFDFHTTYQESPSANRMKRIDVLLTYPREDCEDWVVGCGDNTLDVYVYNETEEWDYNSSEYSNEQRNYGDCSDTDYCVLLSISGSYHVQKYYPGAWMAMIRNEEWHDTQVTDFRIGLIFK